MGREGGWMGGERGGIIFIYCLLAPIVFCTKEKTSFRPSQKVQLDTEELVFASFNERFSFAPAPQFIG